MKEALKVKLRKLQPEEPEEEFSGEPEPTVPSTTDEIPYTTEEIPYNTEETPYSEEPSEDPATGVLPTEYPTEYVDAGEDQEVLNDENEEPIITPDQEGIPSEEGERKESHQSIFSRIMNRRKMKRLMKKGKSSLSSLMKSWKNSRGRKAEGEP